MEISKKMRESSSSSSSSRLELWTLAKIFIPVRYTMPKHFMFCISGYSGVGKDECASVILEKFGGVQTGLADPAKRHMADLYGWSYEQLFGPSKLRNVGDIRYPKSILQELDVSPCADDVLASPPHESLRGKKLWSFTVKGRESFSGRMADILPKLMSVPDDRETRYFIEQGDPRFWLSPREALQIYCEQMNNLYPDTWVEKGINIHRALGEVYDQDESDICYRYRYHRMRGLVERDVKSESSWEKNRGYLITCFADFRHWNEIRAARRVNDMTPILVRIRSQRVPNPPYNHRSETEQATIPDSEFDFVLQNDGTVEEAHAKMEGVVNRVLSEGAPSSTVIL